MGTTLDRRSFISNLSAALAAGSVRISFAAASPASGEALAFGPVAHGVSKSHRLPNGYRAEVLLRWGDPIIPNGPPYDPHNLKSHHQAQQFGYNNDFVAFFPMPYGSETASHGLLCVNHEFTNTNFMWPGINNATVNLTMDAERTLCEQQAVGHSVVEVQRSKDGWKSVLGRFNRRTTATSKIRFSGPAAGHRRMRNLSSAQGTHGFGILSPCGGGKTPWGTVLVGEENFDLVFSGRTTDASENRNHRRYAIGRRSIYRWWGKHFERFQIAKDPRQPNHFGWVVEIDPYDPHSIPVKRTALGRFKHEAATCALTADGRIAVYSGDDQAFEYIYKFVTRQKFNPHERGANKDLLDDGTLFAARLNHDGTLEWLPLIAGNGPLTADNGFADQADVLIEARRAADLLGATRLDRPEDVETNPRDGYVYALLTNNSARESSLTDPANPRGPNLDGHILRLIPPGAPGAQADHGAHRFRWEVFALAGDPNSETGARYPGKVGKDGWFASPDNCAFDPQGRLWVATDQGRKWRRTGTADGLYAFGADNSGHPIVRQFFRAPIGAEVCGPEFTPDGKTLFLSIQHPGVDGVDGGDFDNPGTRWPDFSDHGPPRPSVLAITREDGDLI